jgi:hypothetical protein
VSTLGQMPNGSVREEVGQEIPYKYGHGEDLYVKGTTKRRILIATLLVIAATISSPSFARAEESGSGHYLPGATASFLDMLPDRGTSTFAYLNAFTFYDGSAGASQNLDLGGRVVANVKGTSYADSSIFLYQAPWKLLGAQYAAVVVVPYVWLDVKANATLSAPGVSLSHEARGTANGFGDVQIFPLMFGWKRGDLKWQTYFSVYAPTGDFEKGALANIGKNYWTFEPGAAVSFLSSKYGLEATLFTGFDFDTENGATEYQSGDQFHLDGTVAQHLPLLGGFVGAGANGFFYQQITGDGGRGAQLGSFEGMTTGVGPVLSYVTKSETWTSPLRRSGSRKSQRRIGSTGI